MNQKIQQCPVYKKCGGCSLQNLDYESQLRLKQKNVNKLLGSFHRVSPIAGMKNPLHYRNKAQAIFASSRGKVVSGIYKSGSRSMTVFGDCMIQDEQSNAIISDIAKLAQSFKIRPYNMETRSGALRHVLVRKSFATGEIMVVLVLFEDSIKNEKSFVNALLGRHPEISTVVINISRGRVPLVLGKEERVAFGEGKITDILCGKKFIISPRSFYQVNPAQTEQLYSIAAEFAELTGKETVIDAYCGTGTIGLSVADRAKRVIGADNNAAAIADAKRNAEINKAENAEFYLADAGEFMEELAASGDSADVLFMDPPRAGSSKKFISSALRLAPKRIVYISCNPETQRRDLYHLTRGGYKVTKIKPVDMFPFTSHVETVCFLTKEVGK